MVDHQTNRIRYHCVVGYNVTDVHPSRSTALHEDAHNVCNDGLKSPLVQIGLCENYQKLHSSTTLGAQDPFGPGKPADVKV